MGRYLTFDAGQYLPIFTPIHRVQYFLMSLMVGIPTYIVMEKVMRNF